MYTIITPKEKNDIINYAFNKQAALSDTTKNTLVGALAGALGGSGVGYLSYLLTPKDKDENKRRKFWSHLLSGATFGTMAGAGLGYYTGIKSDKNQANQAESQNTGPGNAETAANSVVDFVNKTPVLRIPVETTIGGGVGAGGGWLTNKIVNHTDAKAIIDRSGTKPIIPVGANANLNPISSVEDRVALEKYYREHPDMWKDLSSPGGRITLDNGKVVTSLTDSMPNTMAYIQSNPLPTTYRAFKKMAPADRLVFMQALATDNLLPGNVNFNDKGTIKTVYKYLDTIRNLQKRYNPNSKRNIVLRNVNGKTLGATGALIGLLTGIFGGPSTGAAD